ncbi:transposase mutator type [Gracilinema caldarium DSM 7334]|uniref:Mutator family transposase n=1 Tax=Gracilinema caldarium (strain ATCC 51460 / DSM 7334 / H1) TaxID=744872 RepID=F8F0W2_GRAC1|nr:IS256 family transposase [Gracilinema caldarium]AEJ20248.1 transposase mutator type [Gracilinema caldarium DSM 7334]
MAITKEVLDELMKEYRGPDDLIGPDGLLKQLTKALIERSMGAELTEHVGYEKHDQGEKPTTNRRNGKTKKTLRTDQGPIEIEVPRDRDGTFEPAIVPKHQREFKGFDDKILSMYARGMTTREIAGHRKAVAADLKRFTPPQVKLPQKRNSPNLPSGGMPNTPRLLDHGKCDG